MLQREVRMATLTLRILGCGSSGGGSSGRAGRRRPSRSRRGARRRRCSILVERREADAATTLLIDTSPDLREQLLDAGVMRLDAVLFTHAHADHTHGIDDLRPLVIQMRARIPVHADALTSDLLRARFGYCFTTPPGSAYPPILDLRDLPHHETLSVRGQGGAITAEALPVEHGNEAALGFRLGPAAYIPDLSLLPDASRARLHDLDLLIIDALRETPHPTHYSVSEALALIDDVRPRRAILTNLHTDLDHATLAAKLPPGVVPAHDGLTVTLDLPA
jgi:phosphoribosyl 1,2-cyclic phosphate phosphodiesterase